MRNKFLMSLLAVIFSLNSWAQVEESRSNNLGSACGLTDFKDTEDGWKEIGPSYELYNYSAEQIEKLPSLTQFQLIITANWLLSRDEESENTISRTVDAVEYLKNNGDPYVSDYRVNGKVYTEVVSYPGDNAAGLIFKQGTSEVVAFNGDDDIFCQDSE
jgi:hypothetical protein